MLGLESNDLGIVLVAIIGALTTLLSGQKLRDMREAVPPPEGETVEVRGALITDKAADRIVQCMADFTHSATMLKTSIDYDVEAKRQLTKALNSAAESLESNAGIIKENSMAAATVATRAHELENTIAVLAKELEFQSRSKG